jgi:hypothetical protein
MPNRERLLELALMGLEAERAKIDDEIAQIKSQVRGGGESSSTQTGNAGAAAQPKETREMSAAAKKKISDVMKRRYAENNKAANVSAPEVRKDGSHVRKQARAKSQSARHGLTAAGRKRLSELARKRWVMSRKLGKTTL